MRGQCLHRRRRETRARLGAPRSPDLDRERAIVLGVARKYTALINNGGGSPITSLEYFAGILPEVQRAPVSDEYWAYVARKVKTLEAEYRKRQRPGTRTATTETK